VINDAYNANPASLQASLAAFLSVPSPGLKRLLVIGGMKELGEQSRYYHEELGRWLAGASGIDALFTVGGEGAWMADAAKGAAVYPVVHLAGDDLGESLLGALDNTGLSLENSLLFLKGSRAYKLETLTQSLAAKPVSRK
jgi:UDP-N-acetylmuramoyl-tripeptide--D-alanyl-D-alanine ligase